MANVMERLQRPSLVIAHNKTLAAQLCNEFREYFPDNAVEYFVSYYDYYQPEAYLPTSDTYIEKDSSINDDIDRLRHSATSSLLARRDVVIVASVSCIYGLGSPAEYEERLVRSTSGVSTRATSCCARWSTSSTSATTCCSGAARFRARGDVVEVQPAYSETAYRISLFGDEVEQITHFDPLTGEVYGRVEDLVDLPGHALRHDAANDRARARGDPRRARRAPGRAGAARTSCSRRTGCASAPSTTWR